MRHSLLLMTGAKLLSCARSGAGTLWMLEGYGDLEINDEFITAGIVKIG